MNRFLFSKLIHTIVVGALVITMLSVLITLVPGDPARVILGPRATPQLIERVRDVMDLDLPPVQQTLKFFQRLFTGDLGNDVFSGRPILNVVTSVMPHTFALAGAALFLVIVLGIPLGVLSAAKRNTAIDRVLSFISVSFITIPTYVSGLFGLIIFASLLRWVPSYGTGDGSVLSYLGHLVLPAFVLALTWIGYLGRLVRNNILEVMQEPFIRTARAQGASERRVLFKFALRNALGPTVTILGVGLGSLLAGAIFVEIIFSRPGLGSLLVNAIEARNYPIVRVGTLFTAFLFVFANLLAEIANAMLDPRIRIGDGSSE